MAIDFTGHSTYSIAEAQRRIDFLRRTRPDWFGGVLQLTDAGLGRFDREIALTFAMDVRCTFAMFLLNKDWLDAARDAVEYVYEVFGTDELLVTYGKDSIRPPLRAYLPMRID